MRAPYSARYRYFKVGEGLRAYPSGLRLLHFFDAQSIRLLLKEIQGNMAIHTKKIASATCLDSEQKFPCPNPEINFRSNINIKITKIFHSTLLVESGIRKYFPVGLRWKIFKIELRDLRSFCVPFYTPIYKTINIVLNHDSL